MAAGAEGQFPVMSNNTGPNATGAEHVTASPALCVTFVGCRVEVLDHASLMHPATLRPPVFLIEPLGPCDQLLITSIRVGHGDNELAVIEVPAALFEMPTPQVLLMTPLQPGVAFRLEFANRAKEPAPFLVWLGSYEGIRAKWERLQAQKASSQS